MNVISWLALCGSELRTESDQLTTGFSCCWNFGIFVLHGRCAFFQPPWLLRFWTWRRFLLKLSGANKSCFVSVWDNDCRRKFSCQPFDNMDRWKIRGGKSQRREEKRRREKRREERRERIRGTKMQVRETFCFSNDLWLRSPVGSKI